MNKEKSPKLEDYNKVVKIVKENDGKYNKKELFNQMNKQKSPFIRVEDCTKCLVHPNMECDFHYGLWVGRNQTLAENDKVWFERLKEHEPRWQKVGFEKAFAQVERIIKRYRNDFINAHKEYINSAREFISLFDNLEEEIKNLKEVGKK